jgi:hypothetical protein
MRRRLLIGALFSSACAMTATAAAQPAAPPSITYPHVKTVNVTETQFGVPVADPYRWLEN